jgi:hypothetical protein
MGKKRRGVKAHRRLLRINAKKKNHKGHKEHEGFRLENFIFVPSFVPFVVKILHCFVELSGFLKLWKISMRLSW